MAQPLSSSSSAPQAVVLFDGVCNLCNGWVSFLIAHDPAGRLHFGSLQSPAAHALLGALGKPAPSEPESVILVEGGRIYERSTAALRILGHLGGGWRVLTLLLVIPVPLRDAVYRAIASSRYRLFGKRAACRVPTAAERDRFIDTPASV